MRSMISGSIAAFLMSGGAFGADGGEDGVLCRADGRVGEFDHVPFNPKCACAK